MTGALTGKFSISQKLIPSSSWISINMSSGSGWVWSSWLPVRPTPVHPGSWYRGSISFSRRTSSRKPVFHLLLWVHSFFHFHFINGRRTVNRPLSGDYHFLPVISLTLSLNWLIRSGGMLKRTLRLYRVRYFNIHIPVPYRNHKRLSGRGGVMFQGIFNQQL